MILNTKWKDCKSRKNLSTKNFTYTKKFYVHEIAAVNLSKIFFLKNAKKTCKPNNRDLNRYWIVANPLRYSSIPDYFSSSPWSEAAIRGVLKNFAKITGKHLCHSLFFNKVTALRPATLFKKWLSEFCEIFKNIFLQNASA